MEPQREIKSARPPETLARVALRARRRGRPPPSHFVRAPLAEAASTSSVYGTPVTPSLPVLVPDGPTAPCLFLLLTGMNSPNAQSGCICFKHSCLGSNSWICSSASVP